MSWSRAFEDPIPQPRARQFVTLEEAAAYITKVPKAVHEAPEWLLSRRAPDFGKPGANHHSCLKCCDRKGWNITWPPDSLELEVCKHLN
jgi:hypothetical protein